jgi:uridine kinase
MGAKPVIIGVAGGTGSGKTTVVQRIIEGFGSDEVAVIMHDSYYRDRSHLPLAERDSINYDHTEALETSLLVHHLGCLLDGQAIRVPVYDFVTHTRTQATRTVYPRKVILVEGILILADASLRSLLHIKIYVDTDADIRFIRRMERDLAERGRSLRSIVDQYTSSVRPMHLEFVEPSKRYADVIIPEGGFNCVAVDMVMVKVRSLLSEP